VRILLTGSQVPELGTKVVWEDLASDNVRRKVEVEKHWTWLENPTERVAQSEQKHPRIPLILWEDAANPGSWAKILQSQCQVSLVY
jgi:hypothetical protein